LLIIYGTWLESGEHIQGNHHIKTSLNVYNVKNDSVEGLSIEIILTEFYLCNFRTYFSPKVQFQFQPFIHTEELHFVWIH